MGRRGGDERVGSARAIDGETEGWIKALIALRVETNAIEWSPG